MASNSLTVVAVQASVDVPLGERVDRALRILDEIHREHGKVLSVLPEYYLAQFDPEPSRTVASAEPVPGPSTRPFLDFAARKGCVIVVGLLEVSDEPSRPFNTAAVLGPDGVIGIYRKTHLWDLGPEKEPYRECKLFKPGSTLRCFSVFGTNAGVMICANGLFPEVSRALAIQGADLILYPNSREQVGPEAESAATANATPVVVSNPVGFNGVDRCGGTSRILGPAGELLASVRGTLPGYVAATLDLDEIAALKAGHGPLRLRRPDLYGPLVN